MNPNLPTSFAQHALGRGARPGSSSRDGNEVKTPVQLADGSTAQLAVLVAELSNDESIRRRYLRDLERLSSLAPTGVAELLAWHAGSGREDPPWRLTRDVEGQSFESWLEEHAPAPEEAVAQRMAAVCERLAPLHARGLVIRDLSPAKIIFTPEGEAWLVDVGLARTDILSTRTAASLVLEGSPYGAPEMLMRTVVDGRADLYSVGVMAFRGLTGELPFGDTHALLRPEGEAPHPAQLRPTISSAMDELVVSLLASSPEGRPESASLVADRLRGERVQLARVHEQLECQACGARLPLGQRLCLQCGRLAVQYLHAPDELPADARRKVVLKKAREEGVFVSALRRVSDELSEGEVPPLNFILGDQRMYSKEEQNTRLKLPVTLFNDLDESTATAIAKRYEQAGVEVVVKEIESVDLGGRPGALKKQQKMILGGIAGAFVALSILLLALSVPATPVIPIIGGIMVFSLLLAGGIMSHVNKQSFMRAGRSLMTLRSAPAALPASDPLVSRLASSLQASTAEDVRSLVSRLALLVQNMVDHRAEHGAVAAEIDLATSPLAQLVELVVSHAERVQALDEQLSELDEGRLVRALAASQARDEDASARQPLLEALDRLRELEVQRAGLMAALSEGCDLARRSVRLGMQVEDPEAEHERQVQLALAALERA